MKKRSENGQVLVEFAFGLPLILTMLFFLLEAGFFVNARQALQASLREGVVGAGMLLRADGAFNSGDRAALVEAMRTVLRQPGLENGTAGINTVKHKGRRYLLVQVEAMYRGVTPLKRFFAGKPLKLSMRLPDGRGAHPAGGDNGNGAEK